MKQWLESFFEEKQVTPKREQEARYLQDTTERKIVDAIKKFAEERKYQVIETPFDDEDRTFLDLSDLEGPLSFDLYHMSGWDTSSWHSYEGWLEFEWQHGVVVRVDCSVEPPKQICLLKHIRTVTARQNTGNLSWLGELEGVRRINLEIRQKAFPQFPSSCKSRDSLEELSLYFSEAGDFEIPLEIQNLTSLRRIGIHGYSYYPHDKDAVIELPDWINNFPNLDLLDMANSHLRAIPYNLVLTELRFQTGYSSSVQDYISSILLWGVTLDEGDLSLFAQPREVIEAYYQGRVTEAVNECKVIFLGDGAAGKSSLIERMVNGTFIPGSLPTDGVKMTKWETHMGNKPFTLRFLDFGGQEIMHSMHRCFLTAHTVYVVVCESRDDTEIDSVAARWLETVKAFAPDCPVILALNKADLNANVSVNERDLKERNPNLQYVLKTSAAAEPNKKYGVNHLLAEIMEQIPGCLNRITANGNMLAVKRELENMEDDYISSVRYREICAEHHIDEETLQYQWLNYFKDLGVAYSYDPSESDDLDTRLESIRVLNPAWLTNGIYRLILRTEENGFLPIRTIQKTLRATHAGDIMRDKSYTKDETEFILHVMRKFEISHYIGKGVEMIPMKMPKTPPASADEFLKKDALHLRWEGTYLPNNLIHRLLIRKFPELDTKCVWRTGGRFRQIGGGCEALAEMNDKALDVYVNGDRDCRQYLETFRGVIRNILDGLNLKTEEIICHTVNGREGKVSYQAALSHLHNNKPEIYLANIDAYVSPVLLLKEIYVDVDRELARYRQELEHTFRPAPPPPDKPPEKAENPLDDEKTRAEIEQLKAEAKKNNVAVTLTVARALLIPALIVLAWVAGRSDLIEKFLEFLFSLFNG